MKRFIIPGIVLALFAALLFSCKHQPPTPTPPPTNIDSLTADSLSNYPPAVATIMINKCAIAGCHNAASYIGANNLRLDTWDHLFDGGANGSEVIPYSTRFSPLLLFVNTDPTLGTVSVPTMPYSTPARPMAPLSKDEYMVLYNWVASGAPDRKGNIAFADNPDTRQKIYMTQQGCDLLAVIDAERKVIMRYIPIGMNPNSIESPHCVRVSSDGMYAYVSFLAGSYEQKIDTRTDTVIASVNVNSVLPGGAGGSWNIVYVSPDNNTLLTSDWTGNGLIATINASTMQIDNSKIYQGSGIFVYPHGIESNATFDTFFITAQYGNVVYKITPTFYYKKISLNGQPASTLVSDSTNSASPNPHEILMVPDRSRYFVTCQTTNEVRVLDAHTDAILKAVPVGTFPQELALSKTMPYMFVTCMEDGSNPLSGRRGSVYVINYNTYEVVKVIYGDFYQPHGVTVDDKNGVVYIASSNANPNGPAPHHASACGGRDGWYSIYDLNTLQPLNNTRYEVSVYPYSAAVRFK